MKTIPARGYGSVIEDNARTAEFEVSFRKKSQQSIAVNPQKQQQEQKQ